jgi:hypothetical protein
VRNSQPVGVGGRGKKDGNSPAPYLPLITWALSKFIWTWGFYKSIPIESTPNYQLNEPVLIAWVEVFSPTPHLSPPSTLTVMTRSISLCRLLPLLINYRLERKKKFLMCKDIRTSVADIHYMYEIWFLYYTIITTAQQLLTWGWAPVCGTHSHVRGYCAVVILVL